MKTPLGIIDLVLALIIVALVALCAHSYRSGADHQKAIDSAAQLSEELSK